MENPNKKLMTEYLFTVADVFESLNIDFMLFAGTLLGAVRDKDFIAWDKDIDLCTTQLILDDNELMYELVDRLKRKHFIIPHICHKYRLSIRKIGEVFALDVDILHLKQFNVFEQHKYYFEDWNGGFYMDARYFHDHDEIEFLGRKFKTPKNAEEFLSHYYGEHWRKPQDIDVVAVRKLNPRVNMVQIPTIYITRDK